MASPALVNFSASCVMGSDPLTHLAVLTARSLGPPLHEAPSCLETQALQNGAQFRLSFRFEVQVLQNGIPLPRQSLRFKHVSGA